MNVSVLVATYGDENWAQLALARAIPSAWREEPFEVICCHQEEGTVSSSRNAAASDAEGDYLLVLDADDEIAPSFITAMQQAVRAHPSPERTLFTPRVSYVQGKHTRPPKFWPEVPLSRGNWLVIGTLIHRDLFWEVGGFHEWPHGLEDWNLWSRCAKAGAEIIKVPRAIYLAHRNPDSKHHVLARDREQYTYWHQKAGHNVWPETYDAVTYEEDEQRTLLDQGRPRRSLRLLDVDGQSERRRVRRILDGRLA